MNKNIVVHYTIITELFFSLLCIIADKVRARGEDVKRCRCGEKLSH